jgi:uncharacterized protein (TIGR03084 family)
VAALDDLIGDLGAETRDLDDQIGHWGADAPEWDLPTPAAGWVIRDQISHLAFFDDAAALALTDPDAFTLFALEAAEQPDDPMAVHLARGRAMDGAELLAWWRNARTRLIQALIPIDPGARIPWFGPPMGVMSFVSARLMETWAHGQDIADALGQCRQPTERLRHVAHLGVRARPFSYQVRGRAVPPGTIEIRLISPAGVPWSWVVGETVAEPATAAVAGSALDFCLVVTQRRNVADTSLALTGDAAVEWMSIAQAFAGPPGPGRPPSG